MQSNKNLGAFSTIVFLSLFVFILTLSLPRRGEGEGAFTYQLALPGRKLTFPTDHYSHPDFKIEWWYYTGHLESESGRRYGYQVTFFRFGLRDRQSDIEDKPPLFTELYMAHFAVSDIDRKKFFFRERINRGYQGKAGAETDRYLVWNEDWKVEDWTLDIEANPELARGQALLMGYLYRPYTANTVFGRLVYRW